MASYYTGSFMNPSKMDLTIGGIACGFTLGFEWFTMLHAGRQTHRPTVYIILVWLELVACATLSILAFLHLTGVIAPSLLFFTFTAVLWYPQIHAILQILINRTCLLVSSVRTKQLLRWGTFASMAILNIMVFSVWLSAQLGDTALQTPNRWLDHAEKVLFLLVDVGLNWYFIRTVKSHLAAIGNKKYGELVKFNQFIMVVNLLCDCLIIGFMPYPNPFVYVLIHPLAYCIKLNIELSMGQLVVAAAAADKESLPPGGGDSLSWRNPNPNIRTELSNARHDGGDRAEIGSAVSAFSPRRRPHQGARAHVPVPLQALSYPPRAPDCEDVLADAESMDKSTTALENSAWNRSGEKQGLPGAEDAAVVPVAYPNGKLDGAGPL